MASAQEKQEMQKEFEGWLETKFSRTNCNNLSKEKYDQLVSEILTAKGKRAYKTGREKLLLQNYDVIIGKGKSQLVSLAKNSKGLLYVSSDKLFYVLESVHEAMEHAGRDRMIKELRSKYRNISYQQVQKYIDLCKICQRRKGVCRQELLKDTQESDSQLNIIRGKVDIVEYDDDNGFKYILIYQDIKTKFTVLRALKKNTAEVVADKLIHVFALIGAPMVLQSNNDEEYLKSIVFLLKSFWPALNILYGPKDNNFKYSDDIVQEIESLLLSSMMNSNSTRWTKALRFVQFVRNSEFNLELGKTPYEAYFGMPPRLGMLSTDLPPEAVQKMQTENDLMNYLSNPDQFMQTQMTTIPVIINIPSINVTTAPIETIMLDDVEEEAAVDYSVQLEDIKVNGFAEGDIEEDDIEENMGIATKRQHEIIESLEEDLNDCLSSSMPDIFKVKTEYEDIEEDTAKRKSNGFADPKLKKLKIEN